MTETYPQEQSHTSMRIFNLVRDEDVTGVSGTGIVAQGVEFDDGTVALRWLGHTPTTVVHELGTRSVEQLHGHDGKTRIVWVQPSEETPGTTVDPILDNNAPDVNTVGALIGVLAELDPTLPVILQKDAEGNGYSPLSGGEKAAYVAENTWSGEVYALDDTGDDAPPEDSVPCVVLWPVN